MVEYDFTKKSNISIHGCKNAFLLQSSEGRMRACAKMHFCSARLWQSYHKSKDMPQK